MSNYGLVLGVIALLAAGEVLRRSGDVQQQLADAEQRFVLGTVPPPGGDTLDETAARLSKVPILGTRTERMVRRHQTTVAYWRGDYELTRSLAEAAASEPDPEMDLLAANGTFRQAMQQYRTPVTLARALDGVLQRYASLIEENPASTVAAYNYEFVARLRVALAGSRSTAPSAEPPNMHGDQGEPPDSNDKKKGDFNVIVPLRPEERQDQMTPGTGATFQRKG